jgi:hypothetical protein
MAKIKLTKRTECVRLTWAGRLVVLLALLVFVVVVGRILPYFLSPNKPVNGQILVLDGQIPDYAIERAIEIFNKGNYELIVTTGSQISEGYHVSTYKTMADLSRGTFLALGFDSTKVIALPTKFVERNRTFNSANTLNEWLIANMPNIKSIDVLAIGCHARRSWFLFDKANGKHVRVGIISTPHRGFDIDKWWKNSIGTRIVLSETIAYIFVKINT